MTGRYPRRFGKYVLLKPLAKGGMGEIYLAAGGEVGGFEKLCVIKKVITEKADRAKSNRFLDEAKVVLRLGHSALVTTFDAGDVSGEFYIAMELVEGKDLREVWNRCVRTRQRIPLDVALHVVREVARALAYVHAYGDLKLVHRDVAPPNILLAYVGDVKLTDFGLARSILKQEHTAPGVVFGRAAYLAPEQARGEVADARTDIYTLGIVLWELLTGQQFLQLGGLDPAAALAIVRHPKLAPPSSRAPWITPPLDRVVMRALAADRNERYQTAEELRQALSEVIAEVAPRADSARVAEFLRTIYAETIDEERVERDRFLKEVIPQFRAQPSDDEITPEAAPEPPPARARPAPRTIDHPKPSPPLPPPPALDLPRPPRTSQSVKLPGLPGLPPTVAPVSNGAPVRRPVGKAGFGDAASGRAFGAQVVAGCRLIRPLIETRTGSLHVAMRAGTTDEVSVRLVDSPRGLDPAALEKVRGEVTRLSGANVVAVSQVVLGDGGTLQTIGEPLQGTDLANIMRVERRLEGGRALELGVQICRALATAHAAGVMHHHLEPERILVATSATGDKLKVLDFGLAGLGGPPSAMETASAIYRAPEQLLGKTADVRSDVYAVAAVLYEMITGAPPHAASPDPIARKLADPVQSPRMFRPEIPAELESLILASLDRDPAQRPQTVNAFADVLLALGRSRDEHPANEENARPTATGSPDRRRARREAALRVVGGLVPGDAPTERPPLPETSSSNPFKIDDSSDRPTPLRRPTADVIASTGASSSPPIPSVLPQVAPPPAGSLAEVPPAARPTPVQSFGADMLARYGAEREAGARKKVVPILIAALVAATAAAFLLLR